jgi:hypothetical protein
MRSGALSRIFFANVTAKLTEMKEFLCAFINPNNFDDWNMLERESIIE